MTSLEHSTFPASVPVRLQPLVNMTTTCSLCPTRTKLARTLTRGSRQSLCAALHYPGPRPKVHTCRSGEGAARCRRPGAEGMLLPFTCPLDYVLPPGRLGDDPARFGPALDVREHGFLEHPRAAWFSKVRRAPGMTAEGAPDAV